MVDYSRVRGRRSMDSRMVREISRSSRMSAEQGAGWLSAYGGPANYQTISHLKPDERLVYTAVNVDGLGNATDIAQVTGLSEGGVNKALTSLDSKGLVNVSVEPV